MCFWLQGRLMDPRHRPPPLRQTFTMGANKSWSMRDAGWWKVAARTSISATWTSRSWVARWSTTWRHLTSMNLISTCRSTATRLPCQLTRGRTPRQALTGLLTLMQQMAVVERLTSGLTRARLLRLLLLLKQTSRGLTSRPSSSAPVITATSPTVLRLTQTMDLTVPRRVLQRWLPPPPRLPSPARNVTTQTCKIRTTTTRTPVTLRASINIHTSIPPAGPMQPPSLTVCPSLRRTAPLLTGTSQSTRPWQDLERIGGSCSFQVFLSPSPKTLCTTRNGAENPELDEIYNGASGR